MHIHIYNLLFNEVLDSKSSEMIQLLETLISYESSREFKKLGLQALLQILRGSFSTSELQEYLSIFMNERILNPLFQRYIYYDMVVLGIDEERYIMKNKALEIVVNILELATQL